MKRFFLALGAFWAATSILAQTGVVQPQQAYPHPGSANNNQLGMGGLTFSNRLGQAFSPEDLAVQLQNLRSAIDQALPILIAFNEYYSNSVAGGKQTVGSALSGVVSDVLRRNQRAGENVPASQSALGATNLLSMLHSLLNTNSNGAVGASPATAQDLMTLQNDLQPVEAVLQRLNVGGIPSQSPYNNNSQTYPPTAPSPTGR